MLPQRVVISTRFDNKSITHEEKKVKEVFILNITNREKVYFRLPTKMKKTLVARASEKGHTLNAYLFMIIDKAYQEGK